MPHIYLCGLLASWSASLSHLRSSIKQGLLQRCGCWALLLWSQSRFPIKIHSSCDWREACETYKSQCMEEVERANRARPSRCFYRGYLGRLQPRAIHKRPWRYTGVSCSLPRLFWHHSSCFYRRISNKPKYFPRDFDGKVHSTDAESTNKWSDEKFTSKSIHRKLLYQGHKRRWRARNSLQRGVHGVASSSLRSPAPQANNRRQAWDFPWPILDLNLQIFDLSANEDPHPRLKAAEPAANWQCDGPQIAFHREQRNSRVHS